MVENAPGEGVFTRVDVWSDTGRDFACGVRDDGGLVCWGDDSIRRYEVAGPLGASGGFVDVSLGDGLRLGHDSGGEEIKVCGVRDGGSIECWGLEGFSEAGAPEGAFAQVFAGTSLCGLRDGGEFICWSEWGLANGADSPPGTYADVSASRRSGCAVRTDGRLVCWTKNEFGELVLADAPQGEFTQVSVSAGHGCALRVGGEVACWGENRHGQANAPAGEFAQVAVGYADSCGVRAEGGLECWGLGHPSPGEGCYFRFDGLGLLGKIVCKGLGHPSAEEGCFWQVDESGDLAEQKCLKGGASSADSVCQWHHNDFGLLERLVCKSSEPSSPEIVCSWQYNESGFQIGAACGGNESPSSYPLRDSFVQVSRGENAVCGVRADGTAGCWHLDEDREVGRWRHLEGGEPPGVLAQVASVGMRWSGFGHLCGLRPSGTAACWNARNGAPVGAPGGVFTQIAGGRGRACGLRVDATVLCWSARRPYLQQTSSPSGEFTKLDAAGPCGILVGGAIKCWDAVSVQGKPPEEVGRLAQASGGGIVFCGVRAADGSLACWYRHLEEAIELEDEFEGRFLNVAVSPNGSFCAIRADQTLACRGVFSDYSEISPPGGEFSTVAVARSHACAIQTDGAMVCWGPGSHPYESAGLPPDSAPPNPPNPPSAAGPAIGEGPVLGEGFSITGEVVAPGTVLLEWEEVEGAADYELMFHDDHGWALLTDQEPAAGRGVAETEGLEHVALGLPTHMESYWFTVRAWNANGVSRWSDPNRVTVPQWAITPKQAEPFFDPFTAPTRSDIDLERLGDKVREIVPGQGDCDAAPALDVPGITVVEPPADLGDPEAELAVAEVVRIAGGCLLVEYVALEGRTIDQVRDLLASDPSVQAVSEPARGFSPDEDRE